MTNYKQISIKGVVSQDAIIRLSDGAYIPFAEDNTDYQAYLAWVAEGNTPSLPDEAVSE